MPPKKTAAKEVAQLRASMLDSIVDERHSEGNTRQRLAYSEIEAAYQKDPLVYNAVNKKASDLTKKWFIFDGIDPKKDPPAAVVRKLDAFVRRVRLRNVLPALVRHVLTYGDGYVELVYSGDSNKPEFPPSGGRIDRLELVSPRTIRRVRDTAPGPNNGTVLYYEQMVNGRKFPIHSSRIRHLQFYPIGDDDRGLSGIETAYINILAKIKGDKALGEMLAWYAKGFHVLNIKDATEEEITAAWKMLTKAREKGTNEFVGSDRHEFGVENGAVVNPEPFLENFYYNLAAAFGMPKDVLIGASAGAITGSETNLRDYYESLDALLQTDVTPFLEELFAVELGVPVDELPVRIVWNPLYVNEKTEADTRFQNAQAASKGHLDGVLTPNEYRWMAFGLDPVKGGDELPPKPTDLLNTAPDGEPFSDESPEDELKRLAGDNAE